MTMQSLCHQRMVLSASALACLLALSGSAGAEETANDYPTHARVEYVTQCIARTGGQFSNLYKCSCVIDRIAARLSYDEFVEAATYARYSSLAGEAGAVFRDSEHAKKMAGLFRTAESDAFQACGLGAPPT